MNLKQLIYKRLVHAKDIGGLLANTPDTGCLRH